LISPEERSAQCYGVPGSPRNTTFSMAATKSRVAEMGDLLALEAAGTLEVERLQALAGG
jgi:hypothetical protein